MEVQRGVTETQIQGQQSPQESSAQEAQRELRKLGIMFDYGDGEEYTTRPSDLPDRRSAFERTRDEILLKAAQVQSLGAQIELEGSVKTREDMQEQTKKTQAILVGQQKRMLNNIISEQRTNNIVPLPLYERTEQNQRLQQQLNVKYFGSPLDQRGQRPIVFRPGWNYTRANLGAPRFS